LLDNGGDAPTRRVGRPAIKPTLVLGVAIP
jgi:hypothetical protein